MSHLLTGDVKCCNFFFLRKHRFDSNIASRAVNVCVHVPLCVFPWMCRGFIHTEQKSSAVNVILEPVQYKYFCSISVRNNLLGPNQLLRCRLDAQKPVCRSCSRMQHSPVLIRTKESLRNTITFLKGSWMVDRNNSNNVNSFLERRQVVWLQYIKKTVKHMYSLYCMCII